MERLPTLIATVGLPYSGKTTYAKTCCGHPIVNPDSIRFALHGKRYLALAEPFVWAIAKVMVRALFMAGHHTVILDATNTTRKRREEWQSDEWRTTFRLLGTNREQCIARADAAKDGEIIPIINKMADQFEPLGKDETQTDFPEVAGCIGR